MSPNFSDYPICDTDMWVYLYLSDYCGRVFDRHGKLVIADVVEQEILAWEQNNPKYADIANFLKKCKADSNVLVIQHEVHISQEDRAFLEQTLRELNFSNGLLNRPKEKNKGEYVSALYADHFEIPFMHTNDNDFQEGGDGRKAFPDLKVKNWYDIVEEFSENQDEKIRIRSLVEQEQKKMRKSFDEQKESQRKDDLLQALVKKFNANRL